MKILMKL